MLGKLLIIFLALGSVAHAHQPTHHHDRVNHSVHIQKHKPRVSIRWELRNGCWARIEVRRTWVSGHYRGRHWVPGHWQTSKIVTHR